MVFFLTIMTFLVIPVLIVFFLEGVPSLKYMFNKKEKRFKNLKDVLSFYIGEEIGRYRAKDCFEIIQKLNYFYFYKNLKVFYISSGDKAYILCDSSETFDFFKSMVISLGVIVIEEDLPLWCFSCDLLKESQRLKLFDSINDVENFNKFLTKNLQNSFLNNIKNYYIDVEFQIYNMFKISVKNNKSEKVVSFILKWIGTSVYVYIDDFQEYLTNKNLELCIQIEEKSRVLKNNIINCSLKYCDLIK